MRRTIAMMATALALVFTQLSGCTTVRVPDDDVITARVKSALGRAVPESATDITVTSYEGVVGLSGYIPSRDAAVRAVEAARRIEGVKAVQSHLQVARAERQ